MAKNVPKPTFEVRIIGSEVTPESIPLRAISDTLSAVQDLASGRDPYLTQQVPVEKAIGLLKIRRGSAVYGCVARDPDEAIDNLTHVGVLLSGVNNDALDDERLPSTLPPLKSLSDVAKALQCRVEVRRFGDSRNVLFTVSQGDYSRISEKVFFEGETTIIGCVERAGGATEMRCLLRVPGRRRLLYCTVEGKDLVRRLGQHLYEDIAAIGTAVWIHSSWRIHKFTIRDFTQPRLGNPTEAIKDLRDSGLKSWDQIDDPEAYVRELR